MSQFRNSIIALFSILCLLVVYFVIEGSYDNNTMISNEKDRKFYGNTKLVKERGLDTDRIEDIVVDYGRNSFDVYVYQGSTNQLEVKEYMSFEPEEGEYASIDTTKSSIMIKGAKINNTYKWFSNRSCQGYVEIYLPMKYNQNLEIVTESGEIEAKEDATFKSMKVQSASGDIELGNLVILDQISTTSTSGNINIGDLNADIIKASTTSGDMVFGDLGAEKINIVTVSGTISADKLEGERVLKTTSGDIWVSAGSGDTNLKTMSGNIEVVAADGRIDCETSSGDVKMIEGKTLYGNVGSESGNLTIEIEEVIGDIMIKSASGDVDLKISEGNEFYFDTSSVSGDISTYFDHLLNYNKRGTKAEGKVGMSADYVMKINTTSGNISVIK